MVYSRKVVASQRVFGFLERGRELGRSDLGIGGKTQSPVVWLRCEKRPENSHKKKGRR